MKIAFALSVIFVGTLYGAGAIAVGMEIEYRRAESEAKRRAELIPPRPLPTQCTPWVCTKQELAEYREACITRARMSAIKPKG